MNSPKYSSARALGHPEQGDQQGAQQHPEKVTEWKTVWNTPRDTQEGNPEGAQPGGQPGAEQGGQGHAGQGSAAGISEVGARVRTLLRQFERRFGHGQGNGNDLGSGQGHLGTNPPAGANPRNRARSRTRTRPRPKAMPLRTWLVLLVVFISAVGLAVSAVAVSSIMRDVLYNKVDEDLHEANEGWAMSRDLFSTDMSKRPPTEFCVIRIYPSGDYEYFNAFSATPVVDDLVLGAPPQTVASTKESQSTTQWRAIARENDGVITIVAKNLDSEQMLLRGLALIQMMILAAVLAMIAIAGYWFIRRALRPLRVVEKTASQIAAGDLDRRVPDWPQHTEVGQLSHALNIMLGRLQKSVEDAQEKEEQMRRFVGDASHELRTPLTSLRGYTELYRSGATTDVDRVLGKIDAESTRMSLLVEDLLALTRAEGSRLDLRPVDVLEVALSAGSSARAAFPGRTIEVRNDAASVPIINGDADRLHQVLINLITNGLRHGGPEAKVCLRLRRDEASGDVLIDVSDDGKGMEPGVAAHIFERFYREDTSRTRDTGGSGLGLAIVKSLIDQHGGDITVTSAPGEGATFTVRLPARNATVGQPADSPRGPASTGPASSGFVPNGPASTGTVPTEAENHVEAPGEGLAGEASASRSETAARGGYSG